ncbi:monovalent cation/H(+) antiporter subunit G [Flagellatimonas centrodinii]|uniref:monovalent cation/H(+) antiporter subunit G n=1 Tax=Flagellatimonas centrodinii TaxID=2806210 RepID=UPI001FF012B5|nr:monovalent cation/H(+) antiporter subunit G [Flagellatimonas centrodinii]ULQ45142.1 monovalent cation/H(+) antiporter subunit G [Flagellatimonas centrodinii]
MATWIDVLANLLLGAGALLAVMGAIGVLRMPDFFTRTHAGSVTETGGMLLIMSGLLLLAPDLAVAVRLLLIVVFLLFTSPTAVHALAYSAVRDGLKPQLVDGSGSSP